MVNVATLLVLGTGALLAVLCSAAVLFHLQRRKVHVNAISTPAITEHNKRNWFQYFKRRNDISHSEDVEKGVQHKIHDAVAVGNIPSLVEAMRQQITLDEVTAKKNAEGQTDLLFHVRSDIFQQCLNF